MNFINWNARGIKGKKPELTKRFTKYDLCCITETKNKKQEYVNIPGYNCIRGDRKMKNGHGAGGVMICIRKGIKYETIKDLFIPSKVEGIGIRIGVYDRYINFVVIYRSPGGPNAIKEKEWD